MGVEKEIASAAALTEGVDTLRAGLSNFESCTGQMNTIFQDFESRLGRLEGEMLPMKDISAKLTMARRNITSAINKVGTYSLYILLETWNVSSREECATNRKGWHHLISDQRSSPLRCHLSVPVQSADLDGQHQ